MAFGSLGLNIVGDTGGLAGSIERGLGGAIKKLTAMAAGIFAGVTVGNFLKDAVDQASDLNESLNAVNVMLGSGAKSFLDFGKSAANNLGITQAKLNEAVVPMASLLSNAGIEGEDLSKKLQALATRATDVGSVFNKDVNEVLGAMGSALRGETEPARAFGIALDDASIRAKAVEIGLAKTTKEVSNSAKVQAAYALVMDQSAKAAGDFTNTQDSWANLQKRVSALGDEAKASLGAAFLPVLSNVGAKLIPLLQNAGPALANFGTWLVDAGTTAVRVFRDDIMPWLQPTIDALRNLATTVMENFPGIRDLFTSLAPAFLPITLLATQGLPILIDVVGRAVEALSGLGRFFTDHSTIIGAVAVGVGTFAVAVGLASAAAGIWAAVTGGLVTAFWALNTAMSANPIGLVVALVAALAAGFIFAWKKSETFRKVVATAFNGIVSAVGAAIKAIIWFFSGYVDNVLGGFQTVLEGWAHLPDWLGGGKADQAAQAIQTLRNNISAAVTYINGQIDAIVDTVQIDVVVNKPMASDEENRGRARDYAAGQAAAANKAAQDAAAAKAAAAIPTPVVRAASFSGGGGGGGGGGASSKDLAAKEAAKTAKAAKNAAAAAFKSASKTIAARGFVNSITGSEESIKTRLDKLYDALKAAGRKNAAGYVRETEKTLAALARKRDTLTKKLNGKAYSLDEARDYLDGLRKASADMVASIKASVVSMGSVVEAPKGLRPTFAGIRRNLTDAVNQARKWTTAISQLKKLGIDKTSLAQIVEQGPETGLAVAQAIARAGKGGVKQIKTLQGQLAAEGNKVGTSVADVFHANGIKMAEGLVKGLASQEAALDKQMDRLATRMATTLKKQLKIKSPSQVFAGIGSQIGAGVAQGIDASRGMAAGAVGRLGQTITVGPVHVSGLQDPATMRRGGYQAGAAIADTIGARRADLALSGVKR